MHYNFYWFISVSIGSSSRCILYFSLSSYVVWLTTYLWLTPTSSTRTPDFILQILSPFSCLNVLRQCLSSRWLITPNIVCSHECMMRADLDGGTTLSIGHAVSFGTTFTCSCPCPFRSTGQVIGLVAHILITYLPPTHCSILAKFKFVSSTVVIQFLCFLIIQLGAMYESLSLLIL